MLAYFYIHRPSNDMKIAVQQNHLWGKILYRSLEKCSKKPKIIRRQAIT